VAPLAVRDQLQLREWVAAATNPALQTDLRQVATTWIGSACFCPSPVIGVNGNGMHTNVSISKNARTFAGI